jgi:hypothetical protein
MEAIMDDGSIHHTTFHKVESRWLVPTTRRRHFEVQHFHADHSPDPVDVDLMSAVASMVLTIGSSASLMYAAPTLVSTPRE